MINLDNFNRLYYVKSQDGSVWSDKFRTSILVLPFTSNPSSSAYDRSCGLLGVTGMFFRLCKDTETNVVQNFETQAVRPIGDYLVQEKGMLEDQVLIFLDIVRDILCNDNRLNVIDPEFLKYIPLTHENSKKNQKYVDGQTKNAEYLFSMIDSSDILKCQLSKQSNLFTDLIKEALDKGARPKGAKEQGRYYVLPFVKQSFKEDFIWLMQKEPHVVIKYIPLLLHFYLCYSVTQTIAYLQTQDTLFTEPKEAKGCYYILATEPASGKSNAVRSGWSSLVSDEQLTKLYGTIQALDICHCLLSDDEGDDEWGLFGSILSRLKKAPFEESRGALEQVLSAYQKDKRQQLSSREDSKIASVSEIDTTIESYEQFIHKMIDLCTTLQSKEYETKMKQRVLSLMQVRLLSVRREYKVLALDEEMLLFLVALVTRCEKMKIDDMYKAFSKIGILFSFDTRSQIESFLQKLNLIEQKSDSGEAQYVTAIL